MEHHSFPDTSIPAAYGPYSHQVFSTVFQAPYPARSTVQVRMPFGALVGVEVTAYRSLKDSALGNAQLNVA